MRLASPRFVCFVFLLACAVPLAAANATSSAHGQIQFAAGSSTATIRFTARLDVISGDTSGSIDFSGPVEVTPGNFADVTFSADVTCAAFLINEASMSGTVTSSSMPALIGTQTLLTVEDNGQGKNSAPDRYTWVMTSASDCHSFPPPSQVVVDGHVHVRPASVPFF